MKQVLCLMRDINVHEVMDGVGVQSTIDSEGNVKEFIKEYPASNKSMRVYECRACKAFFNGNESFDECKAHLGKFNEQIHPFNH